jgi:dTDP-4-amino-4,6-dideoxygalactose transaminase
MRVATHDFEKRLAKSFGADRCLAFARGSTALYALFAAIAARRGAGEVIIPSICCETVGLAARYAGMQPIFADIDPDTLCMSPRDVAQRINPRTRAIVVVHLFGNYSDPAPFLELRRGRDIVLVEDLAQAAGGKAPGGRPLGAALDCTLLSFADSKIIPGEGGALLLNASFPDLDVEKVRDGLPEAASGRVLGQMALSLRNLVHGLADLWREMPELPVAASFLAVADAYRALIVRRAGVLPADRILAAIGGLDANAAIRSEKHAAYDHHIHGAGVKTVLFPGGSTCWRCPVLIDDPERARTVTAALRAAGIHASNHYFPLDVLFGGPPAAASRRAGLRLLNLWVDPATDENAIRAAAGIVSGAGRAAAT